MPRCLAIIQCRFALGPGPIEEILYSPTLLATPPRSIGKSHSLTLSTLASLGSRLIASSAHELLQPQSQAIKRVRPPDCAMPSKMLEFTSAITSAADRLLQRGQFAPPPCDQQFVRFSDAVIVKN